MIFKATVRQGGRGLGFICHSFLLGNRTREGRGLAEGQVLVRGGRDCPSNLTLGLGMVLGILRVFFISFFPSPYLSGPQT